MSAKRKAAFQDAMDVIVEEAPSDMGKNGDHGKSVSFASDKNGTDRASTVSPSPTPALPPKARVKVEGSVATLQPPVQQTAKQSSPLSAYDVKFTPLYGCFDDTGRGAGPICSLLEVGDVSILFDCGWDIHFDEKMLEPLAAVISKIDLVLISHPDLEHLGGLPYAVGKLGLTAPVFATLPTIKMGQMCVYDAYEMRAMEDESNFKTFSLDDVDKAFEQFKPLKYSQHLRFSEGGRGAGVTITPYAAGRLIGGSLWRICCRTDDSDVVYAMGFNHRREEHLNGSMLESLSRPNVMITDAHNALQPETPPKRKTTSDLMDMLLTALRRGGNVLLPCDTAGRVLEMMLLLDGQWRIKKLGGYRIVLLHSMAFNVGEFAKSQLEWMSDAISKQFDMQKSNPFDMQFVTMVHSLEDLDKLGNTPKVVLATDLSLDYGFAKALLLRWACSPQNLILLTQRGHGVTTARALLQRMAQGKGRSASKSDGVQRVTVEVPMRLPLVAEELAAHLEEEARRRRQATEAEEQKRQTEEMERGQVLTDSDDEGGGDTVVGAKRRRIANVSLYRRFSKPLYLMFGYHDSAVETDDYGTKEAEPIGWLAMSMQEQNDTTALLEEEGERTRLEAIIAEEAEQEAATARELGEDVETEGGEGALDSSIGGVGLLRSNSVYYRNTSVIPTKIVKEQRDLDVRCQVAFLDMEGRSDGHSLRNLISTVGPKQLIVVGGGSKAVEVLARHAKTLHTCEKVITPSSGESTTVTLATDVYDVLLHDSLYSRLRWYAIKGYELAQVNCAVAHAPGAAPTLYVAASKEGEAEGGGGRPAVFVSFGDVRLQDLSTALKRAGFTTVLAAGRLTANGEIIITRGKDGKLNLEGPLGEDYFAVRSILYKQYTIVS